MPVPDPPLGVTNLGLVSLGARSGLRVSRMCLGTANLGQGVQGQHNPERFLWGRRGDGAAAVESNLILETFVEAGGNFFDTANSYQFGESERVLGRFAKNMRDKLVLSTKFSADSSAENRTEYTGNNRKALRLSVEESLKRLDTEYIDFLWVHFPDGLTPLEELVSSLADLVHNQKILYYGLSNFPAWKAAMVTQLADRYGAPAPSAIQVGYNLLDRSAERETMPMAQALGLGMCTWGPLAGGLLSGSYRQEDAKSWRKDNNPRVISPNNPELATDVLRRIARVADARGETPSTISLAWLLSRGKYGNSSVIPIIGPRASDQLRAYLRAGNLRLTADEIRILDGDIQRDDPLQELARVVLGP